MWISGVLTGIFNMFFNPIALESIGWKYYFGYIFFPIAFLLITYFCYPGTRGRTLEQMAFIFDGEEAKLQPADEKSEAMCVVLEQKSL